MNELIKINYGAETPTVSARELHAGLEIGTRFADWFPRMTTYGFESGMDYRLVTQKEKPIILRIHLQNIQITSFP